MSTVQVHQPVITEDSNEQGFLPVLLDYHMNTGWDWMDDVEKDGWYAVGTWGVDGYDLGQWPYVIVVVRNTKDDKGRLYGYGLYCEGDVRTHWYRDRVERWEAITREAFFYWKLNQRDAPNIGWAKTADQLPIDLRRPPGWREGMTPDERRREQEQEN
jgi:hypothetical protein